MYRYSPEGYLQEIIVNGQRYAAVNYKDGDITIAYTIFMERFKYDNLGRVKKYEVYPYRDGIISGKPQVVSIDYDKNGNITEINSPYIESVKFTYSDRNLQTVRSSRGKVDYIYEGHTGRITQINTSWGESTRYEYAGNDLKQITYGNGDYYKYISYKDGLPIEIKNSGGVLTKYRYNVNGLLDYVIDPTGASSTYSYDNQNRVKALSMPDGGLINFNYVWHRPKETGDVVLRKIEITQTMSKASSSPITERRSELQKRRKNITEVLTGRIEDLKEASNMLENGLIIDMFVGEKDTVHANIGTEGNIYEVNSEAAKEFRMLLNITSKTHGRPGSSLLNRWQKFYDTNLSHLIKPKPWISPDGRTVKIKPILIIKSNEVNYKYSNLEKVPVLADNGIIFIASKNTEANNVSETSAKDLVTKINNIPKLTKSNIAFIIRLPDLSGIEKKKWYKEINNLQEIIGKDNVLVDPSKDELENMLQKRGKDAVMIEFTHTEKGIVLKNGEQYTSKDIRQSGDLSHIKYLISSLGTCNLPRLEDGKFATALRGKGVGIVNGSYREVSSKDALEKLKELINILRNIKEYDLYPYHLIDIINQRLGITDQGTTNLGRIELYRDYLPA